MYARGMSTRDIQAHIEELYGAEISATTISNITEKVVETAEEWQARPLQKVYPVIFFDAIHYKVRENGKVFSKASYTCLGIGVDGRKDILGIWIGDNEAATFWLRVCTELKNRGVEDVLITCIDGLKGLPDAIKAVFPETTVQLCIVHMIRNSVKYIPSKHTDEFVVDLKAIYNAPTEDKAVSSLDCLQEKWGKKYPLAVRPWEVHWENLKAFLSYPQEIRRLIYTTNAVESLHRQFRKVTKSKAVFPSDHALFKMLFLAARDVSKKWTMPVHNWTTVISHLAIAYGDRLKLASD
jgi:transposase-like protein